MGRLVKCVWLEALCVTLVASQCPSAAEDGGLIFDGRWGGCQKRLQGGGAISKDVYLYGRFESRFRAINCSGVVVSFFLYKRKSEEDDNEWQEIDIEVLGKDEAYHFQSNIIGGEAGNRIFSQQLHGSPDEKSFAEKYHTFAIDWTPDYVKWLIDGNEIRYVSSADKSVRIPSKPMEVQQSVWAVHPYIEDWGGSFDERCLPGKAEFDWVRVSSYEHDTRQFIPLYEEDFSESGRLLESWEGGDWVLLESSFLLSRSDFRKTAVEQNDGRLTIALMHSDVTTLPDPYGQIFCHERSIRYQPSPDGELTVPRTHPVLGHLDYPSFPISSPTDCQRTCQAHPQCRHFSFTEPHECKIFSHVEDAKVRHPNGTSGPRYCVRWCLAEERDLSFLSRGGTLWSNDADTLTQCNQWCMRDGRCGAVIYDIKTSLCSLKGWSTAIADTDEGNEATPQGIRVTHRNDGLILMSKKIACGWPLRREALPAVFRKDPRSHSAIPMLVGAVGIAMVLLHLLWLLRFYCI
uniref:GH16 domain-containing protein n=1 Tax=Vitrella brassicaformis TaxID=1169539 RepID=A0A7S1PDF3_9ALVE